MIHVLDFDSNIIDFIGNDDNSVIRAEYKRDADSELLDITMLSQRAEHFKKRNRVIIQDKNGIYREFIIVRVEDEGQYVTIECNASYLHDIDSAKPILAGKYEKTTVNDKLSEVLRDTGWTVGDCDFAGIRTMSWTSTQTPYEMIKLIETNHSLKASYEIIINGNEVAERKVNMREPVSLFKGKEILYGKDLVDMKRTIDFSEVKTALLALGPENDKGQRITTVVVDDEAQEQFNLPQRYIWGIYEPESNEQNMTLERLKTLANTELNKRKSASISYEITVVDLEKEYPHEVVRYGDLVRIKNSDFTPSLYAESEVIGFTHDLISDDCTYTFGRIVEYREDDLLKYFRSKLDNFNQKLNDSISNVNTIVQDTLDTELQYYEKKIIKGDIPPTNAVNDVFWLDTSNPNVPILKRYWEGQWIKASVDNVEQIGGITREKALFSELNNTFINLTIQHSKLLNEMHEVMNSEYLVDEDIKVSLNSNLDKTVTVFNNIKTNLESMTPDTATIGKLVDTQALFLKYREQLQALYKVVEQAKLSIDARFKLLQSQYTDEKFNEALSEVAEKFGLQVSEDNQLIGEPNVVQKAISVVTEQTDNKLANYVKSQDYQTDKNGIVERLNNSDSERQQLSNQIADRVTLTEYTGGIKGVKDYADSAVNGLEIGTRNLLEKSNITKTQSPREHMYFADILPTLKKVNVGDTITISFDVQMTKGSYLQVYNSNQRGIRYIDGTTFRDIGTSKKRLSFQAVVKEDTTKRTDLSTIEFYSLYDSGDFATISNMKIEKGNKATDYTPAPEDVDQKLTTLKTEVIQDGRQYSQQVSQQIYNASSKTLNQTLSQYINSISTGHQFTYDENGNITNFTVGSSGIKLNAKVIDMNDGDVTIKDGVTTIKQAFIDRLEVNKMKSVDNKSKLFMEGGNIRLEHVDGRYTTFSNDGIHSYASDKSLIFRLDKDFMQTGATGTSTANMYVGAQNGYEVRFVDASQLPGDGLSSSYNYVNTRGKYGYFDGIAPNQGTHLWLGADGEIRFSNKGFTTYNTVRGAGSYFDFLSMNAIGNNADNFYIKGKPSFEVRIVDWNNNENYINLRAKGVFADNLVGHKETNLWLGTDNEVRIGNRSLSTYKPIRSAGIFSDFISMNAINNSANNFYIKGRPGYAVHFVDWNDGGFIDIQFKEWKANSYEKDKHDISDWERNVLDDFRGNLQLKKYKFNTQADDKYRHGIVIREDETKDEFPKAWRSGTSFSGNEVLWWNTKAIQELAHENDELKARLKLLEDKLNEQKS